MNPTRNTCAQRAAAHLISKHHGGNWRDHYTRLCTTHPPDTPLRLLGTTPARLARMLVNHGIATHLKHDADPHDLTPDTIACVDMRPLTSGLPRLHWTIIDNATTRGVRTEGRWHPWDAWMRAWTCRVSPFAMHRRALVVPELTLTRYRASRASELR